MELPLLVMLWTAIGTLVIFALGAVSMRWWLRRRTPGEVTSGEKRCGICSVALGVGAIRTSAGRWRCAEHKQTA